MEGGENMIVERDAGKSHGRGNRRKRRESLSTERAASTRGASRTGRWGLPHLSLLLFF